MLIAPLIAITSTIWAIRTGRYHWAAALSSVGLPWMTHDTAAVSSSPTNIQANDWLSNPADSAAAGRTPSCDGLAYGFWLWLWLIASALLAGCRFGSLGGGRWSVVAGGGGSGTRPAPALGPGRRAGPRLRLFGRPGKDPDEIGQTVQIR